MHRSKNLDNLRKITKSVHKDLNDYISNVNEKDPLFGYPNILYSPPNEETQQSKWTMITKPIIDPVMAKKFKFVLKQLRKSKEEEEYANSVFKAFSYGKNIRKMGDLPNIKTTLKSLYGKFHQSLICLNLATIRKYNRKPKIKIQHEGEDFTQYFHLHSLQHLTSGTNHLQIK